MYVYTDRQTETDRQTDYYNGTSREAGERKQLKF